MKRQPFFIPYVYSNEPNNNIMSMKKTYRVWAIIEVHEVDENGNERHYDLKESLDDQVAISSEMDSLKEAREFIVDI